MTPALPLIFSAAFVGFVHSLSPGHWLPVVLMVKARKWSRAQAAFGALVAASGHIFVSVGLGLLALFVGKRFFGPHLHEIEEHAGLILVAFGIAYAVYSKFNHRHCHGHEHHGPDPRKSEKAPYIFLFSLGFSPCFAVLPVFATAIGSTSAVLIGAMVAFALGVTSSLMGGSLLVARGLVKLDHPIFEHYGDVITGFGVALMGALLLVFPHHDANAAPAPTPSPSVAIHPAPKPPKYISSDLFETFRKKIVLPPKPGSADQKADEAELLERQRTRTAEDCRRAESEVHVSLPNFFGPGSGILSDSEVSALESDFDQFRNDTDFYVQKLKRAFPRPRPFTYIKGLQPCVPLEVTGAYPSGHAAIAEVYAKILSDVYPKKRKALEKRANLIATDRVLGGVHHPTDIRAGRELGDLVYSKLRDSAEYRAWLRQERGKPFSRQIE